MARLTVREFIDLLEEGIQLGEVNEDSTVITNHNSHVGYVVDCIEYNGTLELITKYGIK